MFEVKHGNEDTVREMLRIKRSVQATYNTQVNFMSAQMLAAASNTTGRLLFCVDNKTGYNSHQKTISFKIAIANSLLLMKYGVNIMSFTFALPVVEECDAAVLPLVQIALDMALCHSIG